MPAHEEYPGSAAYSAMPLRGATASQEIAGRLSCSTKSPTAQITRRRGAVLYGERHEAMGWGSGHILGRASMPSVNNRRSLNLVAPNVKAAVHRSRGWWA